MDLEERQEWKSWVKAWSQEAVQRYLENSASDSRVRTKHEKLKSTP
jgi:hypothetical protein